MLLEPLDPSSLPRDLLPDPERLREAISLHNDRANNLRKLLRLVLRLQRQTVNDRPNRSEASRAG